MESADHAMLGYLNQRISQFIDQNQLDNALHTSISALQTDPNHPDTITSCGRIALRLECDSAARIIYPLLLGMFPGENENYLRLERQVRSHNAAPALESQTKNLLDHMIELLTAANSEREAKLSDLWHHYKPSTHDSKYWIGGCLLRFHVCHIELQAQRNWHKNLSPLLRIITDSYSRSPTRQLILPHQFFLSSYRYSLAKYHIRLYESKLAEPQLPDEWHQNLVEFESYRLGCWDDTEIKLLKRIEEAFGPINTESFLSYHTYHLCYALMLFRSSMRISVLIDSDAVFQRYLDHLRREKPNLSENVYLSRVLSGNNHPLEKALWYIDNFQELGKFRDKHRGETCFIIGNGPSLNRMDLAPLRSRTTIGLNKIYLLFDQLGFETTYLAAANAYVIQQAAQEYRGLTAYQFVMMWGREFQQKNDKVVFLRENCSSHFMRDIVQGVCIDCTVTYMAMQIAYFMGFSTVIIIGVDHYFKSKGLPHKTVTLKGDDPNHFDPNYFGHGIPWQLPDLEGSERAYREAKRVFEEDGRQILDATVGGHLQIFEKISYNDALTLSQPPADIEHTKRPGE